MFKFETVKRLWRLLELDADPLDSGESGNDLAKVGLVRVIVVPNRIGRC